MNQVWNWVVTWKDKDGGWHNDFFIPVDSYYPVLFNVTKSKDPRQAAVNYAKDLLDWGIDSVHFHEEGYA